jgi:predicted Zn-dependent protease
MNTEDFPGSANCFDSLAEALAKSGDIVQACAAYNNALAIDQHYPNAAYAQKFLAEHAEK